MPFVIKKIQRKYIFYGSIALTFLILLFGALSQAGFVFSGPYLVRGGELTIEQARPNSTVFIDNKRTGVVDKRGTASFPSIKPGNRNLIVSHDDTWPWTFEFTSISGKITTLQPLQVNIETNSTTLSDDKEDSLFQLAKTELSNYREPSRIQPLERGETKIWVEGTTIFAKERDVVRKIFPSQNPIRNVFWFGNRDDAIIVTTLNNVFALDIRENPVQNFLPIYTGSAPEAVANPLDINKIFVRDADQYFSIGI